MTYTQDITPNLDPYIYENGGVLTDWLGWCLAYVQTAFAAGWAGSTAWDAWTNHVQYKHADGNLPGGVYVPIWFSGYGGMGHVAIYKDGRVWSSPWTHKPYADVLSSIAQVESYYHVTYVGWSEDVGGKRVIEPIAASVTNTSQGGDMITQATLTFIYQQLLGRDPDSGGITHYVGNYTPDFVIDDIRKSDEYQQHLADVNAANAAASKALSDDEATITQLKQTVTDATSQSDATKAQLQAALAKVADLTNQLNSKPAPSTTPTQQAQLSALSNIVSFFKGLFGIK